MSTTSRGKYIEKKAENKLKEEGYWVEKVKWVKWQPKDFFGCWDLIAVNQKHIRFIQVSAGELSDRSRQKKEQMLAFPKPPGSQKEYWHYDKRSKVFKITKL